MHVNQASQYRWFSKINAGEQINHILRDRASEGDTNSDWSECSIEDSWWQRRSENEASRVAANYVD